jgi:hypothetical protein
MSPKPFTIQVPPEVLDDLRSRLARTRWPDPLPYPSWAAGVDIGYLKDLVACCQHGGTGKQECRHKRGSLKQMGNLASSSGWATDRQLSFNMIARGGQPSAE